MPSLIHYLRGGAAAIAAVVACAAHASDISCEAPATRASQIICETALFSMGYQRIYADQQRLLKAGVISQADIDAFRRQRDACDAASCLDAVFSAWRQHLTDIGAPRSRQGR